MDAKIKWWYILITFLVIIITRFVLNISKYKRTKNLYAKYNDYLRENGWEFAQYKQEILQLFKDAGLKDSGVIHQEFMGFGQFANMTLSAFDNLMSNRADIAPKIIIAFQEALGVYKRRAMESFSPIFWIEFVVKLPQYLFEFFGVVPEKIGVKIAVVLYWIVCIVFGLHKFDVLKYIIK